jgi:nitrile hydratase subunit beta
MNAPALSRPLPIVKALGEEPGLGVGETIRVSTRFPVGHYRVPHYVRGQTGVVEMILRPAAINNEEEGFGRNAGIKGFYYRIGFPLDRLWPGYRGSPSDRLVIEIFEGWLEKISP